MQEQFPVDPGYRVKPGTGFVDPGEGPKEYKRDYITMKHTARNLNEFGFAHLKKIACLVTCGSLLALAGCGTLTRFPAPIDKMDQAQIPGMTNIRANGDTFSPAFQRDMIESTRQVPKGEFTVDPDGKIRARVLVISGGGANGAFGAGILYGWSRSGKRPRFKLVTGISTGGLSAPFAFLGPKYDEHLKALYTSITSKDIFRLRSILRIFGNDSFADVTPLKKLIRKHINEDILKAVARQHRRGYRLYIGTTNLDTQRFVIWNMGRIADSGHPDALKLFRNVMLASASIPGAFPPVYIKVKVGDKWYDEMHVDGGLRAQLFFYGSVLDVRVFKKTRQKWWPSSASSSGATVYIIRNGYIHTSYKQTRRKLKDIIGRTISTMTKQAAINDLIRVYAVTIRDKGRFYYIGIPDDFIPQAKEAFDQVEMRRLFKLGNEMASDKNFKWNTLPPGFDRKARSSK
jgi:Patatin-like phospholipase